MKEGVWSAGAPWCEVWELVAAARLLSLGSRSQRLTGISASSGPSRALIHRGLASAAELAAFSAGGPSFDLLLAKTAVVRSDGSKNQGGSILGLDRRVKMTSVGSESFSAVGEICSIYKCLRLIRDNTRVLS